MITKNDNDSWFCHLLFTGWFMEGGRVIYASISKAKPSSFSAASVIHVSIRPEAPIKMLSMISGLNLKVLIPAGRLAIDAFYSPLKKL